SAFYTELGNSSISDEHAFFVALHFTTREKNFFRKSAKFIKFFSFPKFQVEVSHPKEIHLATCSPSIF
ncbi:hypothetical protein Q7W32_11890, partial [Streptococcus suis]|nr:hypothetical protein [Streptococcus suis]